MIKPINKKFEELNRFETVEDFSFRDQVFSDEQSLETEVIFDESDEFSDLSTSGLSLEEDDNIFRENITPELIADLGKKVEEFFKADGILKQNAIMDSNRAYEYRPQQLIMGMKIVNAIGKGENLCVEAPTGVGKSFAYLVPLIFRSQFAKFPSVVTTETINLQEQLIEKDIPFLKKVLGIDFRAVIAKGRTNYLCLRRLEMLTGDMRDSLLPNPSMVLELDKINKGQADGDGERSGFNFRISNEVWSLVCSETINCLGPKCPHYRRCFYFSVRKSWDNAHIIIANHALFFTDLRIKIEGGDGELLPKFGMAVVDEAHTLEANAAEHLGLYLSKNIMLGALNKLYNPDNAKGLLLKNGHNALELRKAITDLRDEVYGFFQQFEIFLQKRNESSCRIKQTSVFIDTISGRLIQLSKILGAYMEEQEDPSFKAEIEGYLIRLSDFIDGLDEFLNMTKPNSVYYLESERSNIILRRSPLDVPDLLRKTLFDNMYPVVLSSATLTMRNSFNFFQSRVGYCNGESLILDSPFDPNMVKAFVPRNMVDPTHADYFKMLIFYIKEFIRQTKGKAFVLFTSYSALRQAADALKSFFDEEGIQLLIQGDNMTRSMMLKEFKADINSVIFGTDSFWTGVDVPGESLSNVIITKLPFAVPTNPLVDARNEIINNSGGNPFRDYSIPDAVLKFRQGIGRLIRSKNDKGIIVILDKRIISKSYGKNFSESIPYPINII